MSSRLWDRTWLGVLTRVQDRHREQHRKLVDELTAMAERVRALTVERDLLRDYVANLKRERDAAVEFTVARALTDWDDWDRTRDE